MEMKVRMLMDNLAKSTVPVYESALEKYNTTVVGDLWRVKETKKLSYLIIRGKTSDDDFVKAIESLGLTLPSPMKFIETAERKLIWISPDEFLLVLGDVPLSDFIESAEKAFKDIFAYIIDNSGSFTNIEISGSRHLDVIAKLSPYDYHKLTIGSVISTNLAKAPSIIYRPNENSLTILVRFSFADYLWRTIEKASLEYTK
jgi:sarcosine oxidase subunit gamma